MYTHEATYYRDVQQGYKHNLYTDKLGHVIAKGPSRKKDLVTFGISSLWGSLILGSGYFRKFTVCLHRANPCTLCAFSNVSETCLFVHDHFLVSSRTKKSVWTQLIEGNGYETRQSSLLYVIVPFFSLDPAQNTTVVYSKQRN